MSFVRILSVPGSVFCMWLINKHFSWLKRKLLNYVKKQCVIFWPSSHLPCKQAMFGWTSQWMNHTSPSLENARYKQPQFLEPRGLNPQMLKQYYARKVFPLQNLSKENILKIYVIIWMAEGRHDKNSQLSMMTAWPASQDYISLDLFFLFHFMSVKSHSFWLLFSYAEAFWLGCDGVPK